MQVIESKDIDFKDAKGIKLPDFLDSDTGTHMISESEVCTKKLFIKINEFDNEDKHLNELVKKLYTCKPNTIIEVWISSYGGSVDELIQIVNALSKFKNRGATIISNAMSCGALLYLTFPKDKRYIFPNTTLMIHNYKSWVHGTPDEIENTHKHYKTVLESMIKNLAYEYMTKKERDRFENGKDIFFKDIDLLKRGIAYKIRLEDKLLDYKEYKEYLKEVEKRWKK